MSRRPLVLTNWKMAMTVQESLDFIGAFKKAAGPLLEVVDVVIAPPFTALWPVAKAMDQTSIQLAGQNFTSHNEAAHTGEISASLLADAGCRWVMIGHWEVRRHLGDTDSTVNIKVKEALGTGLTPILFIGEADDTSSSIEEAIQKQLIHTLEGCPEKVLEGMVIVYEPEQTIGANTPSPLTHISRGSRFIRSWLFERWGEKLATSVRIIYGGGVRKDNAFELMTCSELDGLGSTTHGRNVHNFVAIVNTVAQSRSVAKR
ncbi:MAG: triose-phosphate isomerase [Xenococcaceae cyanobacterium]